ncbi:MAG: flagellar protein FlaG [Oceanicaulis sp.]
MNKMEIAKLMTAGAPALTPRDAQSGAAEPQPADAALEPARASAPEDRAPKPADRSLTDRIESMREEINATSRSRLRIDREGEAGRFIYKIVDSETGETMRQWPPEKYLDLVQFLRDQRGGLVDERA